MSLGARRLTTFWKVKSVLSLFIQMGCELRVAEGNVVSDQGDVLNARYLFNPDNGAFVPIMDLGDEEFVSAGEVARMANHGSTRTTQLYDRREEEVTLDEVERVLI